MKEIEQLIQGQTTVDEVINAIQATAELKLKGKQKKTAEELELSVFATLEKAAEEGNPITAIDQMHSTLIGIYQLAGKNEAIAIPSLKVLVVHYLQYRDQNPGISLDDLANS